VEHKAYAYGIPYFLLYTVPRTTVDGFYHGFYYTVLFEKEISAPTLATTHSDALTSSTPCDEPPLARTRP
jgi:hypothetical protein